MNTSSLTKVTALTDRTFKALAGASLSAAGKQAQPLGRSPASLHLASTEARTLFTEPQALRSLRVILVKPEDVTLLRNTTSSCTQPKASYQLSLKNSPTYTNQTWDFTNVGSRKKLPEFWPAKCYRLSGFRLCGWG